MNNANKLADDHHPAIQAKAKGLTSGCSTQWEKLQHIFIFVRDEIRFGFPPKWDTVKASETLEFRVGYCNTKATLFCALCKVVGIPARIHTGLIDIQIMRGIFPSIAFPFLPAAGGHAWMEIEIDGEWRSIDSYINDKPFYERAFKRLQTSGRKAGYSISQAKGSSSCEFNFGEVGFVQMGSVVDETGVWDDFSEYIASDKYLRLNKLQLMSIPIIAAISNRNINRIRRS